MMRWVLVVLGVAFAQCARIFRIRCDVTLANLKRAFPDRSVSFHKNILSRSYSNLGRVFGEFLYLRFATLHGIKKQMNFRNPELFTKLLNEGKGLVVVAGHLANWEWMAIAGPLHLGKNFSVVIKNNPVGATEKFLQRMRRKTGNPLINSADVRSMFRTLRDGGCVALLGDQAAPGESARVNFFGTQLPSFEGPARLALRTRSPMLFAKCVYEGRGRYSTEFIHVQYTDLTGDTPEAVAELTQRHTSLLESAIREHPEQWVWQHRRWKNA